jgi:hypothetical protein
MCAFGWLAHSRNSRLRLFTKDTRSSARSRSPKPHGRTFKATATRSRERDRLYAIQPFIIGVEVGTGRKIAPHQKRLRTAKSIYRIELRASEA